MRKLLFATVLTMAVSLTGCAGKDMLGSLFGKDKEPEEPEYSIEYDEDGNVIPVEVTDEETGETYLIDPESGFRIDPTIEEEVPNEDGMFTEDASVTYDELLNNRTSYPQLTITLYNQNGEPRLVDHYLFDDFNNTAVKYEYNKYNTISLTYYDNKTNKAYTNLGLRGWQEVSNERITDLQVMFNPNGFEQTELYQSGPYVYLKGKLPVSSLGGDKDIISKTIRGNFKSYSDFDLEAMYNAEDNSLFRMELNMTNNDGSYKLAIVPGMNKQSVTVPENVLMKEQPEEHVVDTDMNKIPAYAYAKQVVYGDAEVTRDIVLATYKFKRTDITGKYGSEVDIEAYLESLCTMLTDDMTVLDFFENMANDVYVTLEEKSAADTIREYMLQRDAEITDEEVAALQLKPEPVEYPIEYDEEGNLILIEETDEEGNTIWINPETGKRVNEDGTSIEEEESGEETSEEEQEEQEGTIMTATANVNVRKGPGTGFDKIGSVAAGNTVIVLGVDENDNTWYRVVLEDGTNGCIKSDYLKE